MAVGYNEENSCIGNGDDEKALQIQKESGGSVADIFFRRTAEDACWKTQGRKELGKRPCGSIQQAARKVSVPYRALWNGDIQCGAIHLL